MHTLTLHRPLTHTGTMLHGPRNIAIVSLCLIAFSMPIGSAHGLIGLSRPRSPDEVAAEQARIDRDRQWRVNVVIQTGVMFVCSALFFGAYIVVAKGFPLRSRRIEGKPAGVIAVMVVALSLTIAVATIVLLPV